MKPWMRWTGVSICIAAVLVALWFVPLPKDASAKAVVIATIVAALAAVGSAVAAFASLTSARESAETARQARLAMGLHNWPSGHFRAWSSKDMVAHDTTDYLGEDPRTFGDVVKIWFEVGAPLGDVNSMEFTYSTGTERYGPIAVQNRVLISLPGVAAVSNGGIIRTNIADWTVTCVDTTTGTRWTAFVVVPPNEPLAVLTIPFKPSVLSRPSEN